MLVYQWVRVLQIIQLQVNDHDPMGPKQPALGAAFACTISNMASGCKWPCINKSTDSEITLEMTMGNA